MSDDAVKVHCDMEGGGETCVFPDVHASKMPNIPWRKSGNGWYSSLRGGFKVWSTLIFEAPIKLLVYYVLYDVA